MSVNTLFVLSAVGIAFILFLTLYRSRHARQAWIKKYGDDVTRMLSWMEKLTERFAFLTSMESGYFNNYKLEVWAKEALEAIEIGKSVPNFKIFAEKTDITMFDKFSTLYQDSEKRRQEFNTLFVQNEIKNNSSYFDTVLSKPLDTEQRNAIVIDEDHNLVIAGAGCGKTTTIEGKVKYLVDRYNIDPKEIILISFTRKSAEEMAERVKNKLCIDVEVSTFHSLGMNIIASASGEKPSVLDENLLKSFINNCFHKQRENDEYLRKLNEFFLSYLKIPPNEETIRNPEELRLYLKNNDLVSLKEISFHFNNKTTIQRQYCKSHEEVLIANFLKLNQINYEYEKDYQFPTATPDHRQYQPDFFLPDYAIYIEHYGIDKNGNVPRWFGCGPGGAFSESRYKEANTAYTNKMKWADSVHAHYKTTLVKTFSYENSNGTLLTELERKLKTLGVRFNPLTPRQVWAEIVQAAEKDVTEFELLIATFLTLMKSNNVAIADIKGKVKHIKKSFEKRRAEIFLELFEPIFKEYQANLTKEKKIDFNDMINKSSDCVENRRYSKRISYIIVDEFQDISFSRYKLVKAILYANPGCKLFCVGDDWQSIFRFTGSDITFFTEFEKHFGITARTAINTTYRFNDDIIKISSKFIQQNPNQIKKSLKSKSNYSDIGVRIMSSVANNPDWDLSPIKNAFAEIQADLVKTRIQSANVLILGRYNHDVQQLEKDKHVFKLSRNKNEEKIVVHYLPESRIKAEFLTVHRAKGLEADYTVVLNCNSGKYGLPSEKADDPLLNLLLSSADTYENGEERRLFYVAMTRTKRKVFLITSERNKSKFISEIAQDIQLPREAWDDLPF